MHLLARRSENWASASLLFLPTSLAIAFLYECSGRFVWLVAAAVVGVSAALELGRRMRVRRFRNRAAMNEPLTWAVFVNDVMVARIEDAQYASAELAAWLTPINYVAQTGNFLRVAFATIGRVAVLTPLVLVWALALNAIVSPQETAYMLAHASTLTTKDVASFGQLWTTLSLLALIFAGGVFPFFGMDIGYVNHFERDIQSRVRRLVGTPADGVIRLTLESAAQPALPTPQSAG